MRPSSVSRRYFSWNMAFLFPALHFAGTPLASAEAPVAGSDAVNRISHNADAIHQEVSFKATPDRVYKALTNTYQFNKVVELSGVMKAGMLPAEDNKPTSINGEVGSAFLLFGGYITGRQIELLPGKRIVQVWRAGGWPAGIYSIAKFELLSQGSAGTRIVFDHTGFPNGAAEHLAKGWKEHYWQPLALFLA